MVDDRDVWERICRGDGRAFDALYRMHGPKLEAFLRRMLGSCQAAEDVLQETFTAIWEHPNGFVPERGSFRAYLFGTARKRAVDWWRKHPAPKETVHNELVDSGGETASLLADAVSRLSEEGRTHLATRSGRLFLRRAGADFRNTRWNRGISFVRRARRVEKNMAGDTTREKGGFMKCEGAAEFVSRLCDGQLVPREAAEHIGTCHVCLARLTAYLGSGAELRRLASLEQPAILKHRSWETAQNVPLQWWRKGRTTMRIPRLAFVAMLIVILELSSGLLMVRARAGAASGRFLELKFKPPSPAKPNICIMRADGSQKDNTCNFVQHGHEGLLLMNARVVANEGGRAQVGVRAKYIPVTQDAEVDSEALLKDVPETLLAVELGAKQQVEVANLGTVEVEVEYLDHIPPLFFSPQETLDPNPQEFRIVAPVLVRDNQVIANADGSSIGTGNTDATLMLYVPGEGRYLVSSVPFKSAVEGTVHLGKITFSLEGHNYLLLTSMPITVLDRVWVKHEPDFKPSERMVRPSDARDDRIMYIVRSLKKLEEPRIEH